MADQPQNLNKANVFKITLGDWSSDGHAISENFFVSTATDLDVVFKAYEQALKDHPEYDFKEWFHDYEDNTVPEPAASVFLAHQEEWSDWGEIHEYDGNVHVSGENVVHFIMWLIKRADPTIDLEYVPSYKIPTLVQGGYGLYST